MCNCTVRQKKIWLWGTSGCFLTIAIVFGVLWPSLFESVLHKSLKLRQGSLTYDNWIETPLPMYAEFYMFHWENPGDVYNHDIKPRFVEKGPYVFEEKHTRNDVQFFEGNATVAFNQTKTWHFVPEMSNGTLDDEITNLNTIAMTVGYALRHDNALMKIVGKHLLDWAHEHLLITQTVRNLIFDGYDDKILDLLRVLNLKQFTIPFKKFGWFVERNGSSSYDGRFHMGTGENDIRDLGMLSLWNFESRSPAYKDDCGAIKGTTGELWPPEEDHKKPLTMFITDVCRPLTLNYLEEGEKFNVAAQKFVADESVLDNGDKFPEMKCFCTGMENGKCDIAPGALNVSQCKFGAPAFLSFPHFYLADESYREKIEGMDPDEEKHKFHILMQRGMGIPMEVNAGMQINLLMDEYFNDGLFKGLPRIFVPMFWFRQSAAITEDLARSVYWATKATAIGIYVFIAIGAISGVALLCALYLTVTKKWGNQSLGDDDELLTDQ